MNEHNGAFDLKMYSPDDNNQEMVELIASGYEWNCPSCGRTNKEIEITNTVECPNCWKKYIVDQEAVSHAFH